MTKKIAIMQPYVFPYLGYFHLIQASDFFVFYDDVNFIKSGWINSNQILSNNKTSKFTIPLSGASPNKKILEIKTHNLALYKIKFIKHLEQAYSKSFNLKMGLNYVRNVFGDEDDFISDIAIKSIKEFYTLLDLPFNYLKSSQHYNFNEGLEKSERLVQITKSLNSNNYINAIGGMEIYDKVDFKNKGINLSFVKSHFSEYKQVGSIEFIKGLSIIDILMNNDIRDIRLMINDYELI